MARATIAAAQYASAVAESNVQVIRRAFEGLATDGYESAILPLLAPEFEFTTPPDLASEPDTYRGQAGMRRYFESFYEAMDEIRFEPHEFRELGAWVVVPFTVIARGRSTGLEAEQSAVMAWKLRDGQAVGLEIFAELAEALAAVEQRVG
jgi:ketosteroid isomerase-like protein